MSCTAQSPVRDNNKVQFSRPAREGFCNTIHASAQPARHINTFDKYVQPIYTEAADSFTHTHTHTHTRTHARAVDRICDNNKSIGSRPETSHQRRHPRGTKTETSTHRSAMQTEKHCDIKATCQPHTETPKGLGNEAETRESKHGDTEASRVRRPGITAPRHTSIQTPSKELLSQQGTETTSRRAAYRRRINKSSRKKKGRGRGGGA